MSKLKHYHAIPAVLRGYSRGMPATIISTEHGDIEEGCLNRITSVFSDREKSIEELVKLKDDLASEYLAHIKLAEARIELEENARNSTVEVKSIPLDAEFEKFLNGDFIGFVSFCKGNPIAIKQLRTYTNGKVQTVQQGAITIRRDNGGSLITMLYSLPTKLKIGQPVFVRDNGEKPIPEICAVWADVKDHALRADQLKQFF